MYVCTSISEEEPGPLRSDTEGKSGTKVSRTFSYLKNKMYKKTRVREHGVFNDPFKTLARLYRYNYCIHYTLFTMLFVRPGF